MSGGQVVAQKRVFHAESGRHRMEIVNQQNDLLGLIYFCETAGKYVADLREDDGWISGADADRVRAELPEIAARLRELDAKRAAADE